MEMKASDIVLGHFPCKKCPSSDAAAHYSSGWSHCFSCGANYRWAEGDVLQEVTIRKKPIMEEFKGIYKDVSARKITQQSMEEWDVQFFKYKDVSPAYIFNYYNKDKQLTGQKLKLQDGTYKINGKIEDLYGIHRINSGGKYVIITEGEFDAVAVSQIQDHKYATLSIPHGAQSAKKYLAQNMQFLEEKFQQIILMFDMDKPGQAAAQECARIFTPGKCKIASFSEKDACDMLKAGKHEELIKSIFFAKEYKPEGIVSISDIRKNISTKVKAGLSFPWEPLTKLTNGFRKEEMIVLAAGTGVGKTTIFKEIITHFRTEHNQKIGVLFLEENVNHTLKTLAGMVVNKPIHIAGHEVSEDVLDRALDILDGEGDSIEFFDHFGSTEFETISQNIRWMVAKGADYIFFDHITALIDGEDFIDKLLGKYSKELAQMTRELNFGLAIISHLNTPDGESHEEGGRVKIKHIYGGRKLGQWANYIIALERNQQDVERGQITTVRILKDRDSGQATGKTFELKFNVDTGRLEEYVAPVEDFSAEFTDKAINRFQ